MTGLVFLIVIVLVLLPGLLFYFLQHKYVFAPHYHPERSQMLENSHAYHLQSLEVADGIVLEGMVYEPKAPTMTLLFFGGKGQDSVTLIGRFSLTYPNVRFVSFNYRGYGKSTGTPSEKDIMADALQVFDWCVARYGETAVLGNSLGSSVAAFIGSRRRAQMVILIAAFDSVKSLMKAKVPMLPDLLIRHHFDTVAYVRDVVSPLYLYVTVDDVIVPIAHARVLRDNVRDLVEYKEFSGYNHGELLFSDGLVERLREVFAR